MENAEFFLFEKECSNLEVKCTSLKKKIKDIKRDCDRISAKHEKDLAALEKKVQLGLAQLEAASKKRQEEVTRRNTDVIQCLQNDLKKVTADCSERQEQMTLLSHTRNFEIEV